jgi:RNA-binding protein YhbY
LEHHLSTVVGVGRVGLGLIWEATMATWIKCTSAKHEVVYVNLDNAVTVTRNDVADRITERGTVISFMGGEQVYIVVNEQPEEIINRSHSRSEPSRLDAGPVASVTPAKDCSG